MSAIPRVVVSAPTSGQGKTAVSVGLLAAFAARGMHPAGFKIGPDYIDAANLGLAAGRPARNLDPRMVGAERIGPLFVHGASGADVAVVEGTMGLYDGLAGRTDGASTAQLAGLLRAPVLLVVDAAAMGQSVAALVHGFRVYDELIWLGGVVLNRVASGRHEQLLREALADIGVPVLGAIRERHLAAVGSMPSRGHGVVPAAHRSLDAVRTVRRIGEVIAGSIDLERVLAVARSAPGLAAEAWSPEDALLGAERPGSVLADEQTGTVLTDEPTGALLPVGPDRSVRRPVIAVAAGYGYVETVELLVAAGADVVPIDPLRDEALPERTDGLVIPGGMPESYADELSANERLRRAVAELARTGRPIVAEGTGLVWLCAELDGRPMCGVLNASARSTDLLVMGYREATSAAASWLLPAGTQVVGHKLHRTLVSPRAGAQPAWLWTRGHPEGHVTSGVHASYLALHWAGRPGIAGRVVAAAATIASAFATLEPARTVPVPAVEPATVGPEVVEPKDPELAEDVEPTEDAEAAPVSLDKPDVEAA